MSHNASGEGGSSGGAHDSSGNNRGGGRALPPVTFFVGREKIRVAVSAEGGSFRAGETVARIAIVAGSDYFALKDKLVGLFGAADRFASLRFLGVDPLSPRIDRRFRNLVQSLPRHRRSHDSARSGKPSAPTAIS